MTRRNPRRRPPRSAGEGGPPRGITSLLRPHRKLMVYLLAGGLVLLQALSATFSGAGAAPAAPAGERPGVRGEVVGEVGVEVGGEVGGEIASDAATDAEFAADEAEDDARAATPNPSAERSPPPAQSSSGPAAQASARTVEAARELPPPPAPSAAEPATAAATHAWSDAAALVAAAAEGEVARSVRLQIDSDPPGATVLLAGTPVGRTPLDRAVSATGPTPYRIELAGPQGRRWVPLEGVLDLTDDVRLEVRLWPR